jgi:hypothetical protein
MTNKLLTLTHKKFDFSFGDIGTDNNKKQKKKNTVMSFFFLIIYFFCLPILFYTADNEIQITLKIIWLALNIIGKG